MNCVNLNVEIVFHIQRILNRTTESIHYVSLACEGTLRNNHVAAPSFTNNLTINSSGTQIIPGLAADTEEVELQTVNRHIYCQRCAKLNTHMTEV